MAMTFTLVSHLREQLATLVKAKLERRLFEEKEKERLVLEVRINECAVSIRLHIILMALRRKKRVRRARRSRLSPSRRGKTNS